MVWIASILIALVVALGIALEPYLTFGAVLVLGLPLLGLLAKHLSPGNIFLSALGLLLAGYAFSGRGFAYLGIPPVFIGEAVLTIGLVASILGLHVARMFRSRVSWMLIIFIAWGAFRTIPFLSTFGAVALRDGVVWGYAIFAILVPSALLNSTLITEIPEYYRRFIVPFLLWMPIAVIWSHLGYETLPRIPGTDTPVLSLQETDAACHLAGIAAFLLIRPFGDHRRGVSKETIKSDSFHWVVWAVGFLVCGSQTRSGLLAVIITFLVVMILMPSKRFIKPALLIGFAVTVAMGVSIQTDLGRPRSITPTQIAKNLVSVFSDPDPHLDANKYWRILWWEQIVNDTLFGDQFLLGRGYGYDLSRDFDDVPELEGPPLRSPHSSHITILGRSGVTGALFWITLQITFMLSLLRTYLHARRANERPRAAMTLWVLAYWSAFIVNMSFSLVLENPHGGIWFWSIFGVGIALIVTQATSKSHVAETPV